jgi:S-adenosylmethionine hydrolase
MLKKISLFILISSISSCSFYNKKEDCKSYRFIAFASDFGHGDAVAACHSSVYKNRKGNKFRIIDFNHNLETYNIESASVILERSKDLPSDAVIFAVVDPGVGTDRGSIVFKAKDDRYYIGPNNGIFTDIVQTIGVQDVYKIDQKKVNPDWQSGTFDGRDLYSILAAKLSKSPCKISSFGNKISINDIELIDTSNRIIKNNNGAKVKIVAIDEPYGNIWTKYLGSDFVNDFKIKKGHNFRVKIRGKDYDAKYTHTFGHAEKKTQVIAYIDSRGYLAFALNKGDLRKVWKVDNGDILDIIVK